MGWRWRKSVRISKGVRVNLSQSGVGLSYGIRGLRKSVHSSGRRTTTFSIPGTGISYVKTSGRKASGTTWQQEAAKRNAYAQNAAKIREFDDYIHTITSVHFVSSDPLDWNFVHSRPAPFSPGAKGPREMTALGQKASYSPGILQRTIRPLAVNKRDSLSANLQKAIEEDRAEYEAWKNLKVLSGKLLSGDPDAIIDVLKEEDPLEAIADFLANYEFGIRNGSLLEVVMQINWQQTVPTLKLSLTSAGNLSSSKATKTAYFKLARDHISSCSIRCAREIFALLPIDKVLVHVSQNMVDPGTGLMDDMTILSVFFDRKTVSSIDWTKADPSYAIQNFKHRIDFLQTGGFRPVRPLE